MYKISKPSADLSSIVDYYWELHIAPQKDSFHEFIFSYPFANLVFNLQESYTTIDPVSGEKKISGDVFIGSRFKPISYIHSSGNKIFGVKFQPGGMYPIARISLARTNNELFELANVFQKRDKQAFESTRNIPEFAERIAKTEDILRRSLNTQKLKVLMGVNHVLQPMLSRKNFGQSLTELARVERVSVKTIERKFLEVFGLTPKRVINAIRCRVATREIARTGNFSDCLQYGYYDQSHFIKEVRRFTNKTPTEVLSLMRTGKGM